MLLLTAAASVSAGAVTVFDNLAAANDPWLIQHNSSYHTKLWVANRIPIGSQSLRITQVKMNLTQIDQFELQVCATDASAATPFVDMTACAPSPPTRPRRACACSRATASWRRATLPGWWCAASARP